jgi:peptidoglycan/LPS O-acetylase OafA/YrhL
MGYRQTLTGHLESITRGINDQDSQINQHGLPGVNPVFTWVRLAQRIPVRVAIGTVPPGVLLASGMTCSVSVADAANPDECTVRPSAWRVAGLFVRSPVRQTAGPIPPMRIMKSFNVLLVSLLAACTVGPDYTPPKPVPLANWTEHAATPAEISVASQQLKKWWPDARPAD